MNIKYGYMDGDGKFHEYPPQVDYYRCPLLSGGTCTCAGYCTKFLKESEPNGGNMNKPHRVMITSGEYWRCQHGRTTLDGCTECEPTGGTGERSAAIPEGFKLIGELVELDDDMGTIFTDWNDERWRLPAGTKIFAALDASSTAHQAALQTLVDQAQQLDLGYGDNACPHCGKSAPVTEQVLAAGLKELESIRDGLKDDELATDEIICTKIYKAMRGAQ